jgi:hypothetical protein
MKTPGHLWQPDHVLEAVNIRLHLPKTGDVVFSSSGRSSTSSRDLWSYREVFDAPVRDLEVSDVVHHLVVAVLQDRPRNKGLLDLALRGGSAFEDTPLPF